MLKLFGKVPSDSDTSTNVLIDNESCMEACRITSDCILTFMTSRGYCKMYAYSTTLTLTVQELFSNEGLYVAFKIGFFSEQASCPISYDSYPFMMTISSEVYEWSRTPTGWFITNCPAPWMIFERPDSSKICMQFIHISDYTTTRSEAVETCENLGTKVTGLIEEEVEYWKPALGNDIAWIDGVRDPHCWSTSDECYNQIDQEIYCQNFNYTDGYTPNGPPPPITQECMRSNYPNPDCQVISSDMGIIHTNCAQNNFASGVICGFRMQ